ncbi:MAG: class I SAM-dependent methyltransferase [Lachnospiraceae bacterium]|nr:class I SAM-dependent methyltransferase [Lachnospiraceae bacterium]
MGNFSSNEIHRIVIDAYDKIASEYTSAYAEDDEYDFRYLKLFIERLRGKRILDMGCGTGTIMSFMDRQGFEITGIDASKGMLSIAQRDFPAFDFVEGNILSTCFDDADFDGIILSYTVNHFTDDDISKLATEIDRLLKENGLVYISAHVGNGEGIFPDPLDASLKIYYNLLTQDKLDRLFSGFQRVYFETRKSFGEEEFLWDKMFLVYEAKKRM